ncbi:MAG TPA: glycerophosphodiester phosphodiesterase family protein, partial [Acidobacteriaceae bacterium]|nr:glycerophosphodiester phosphodiesterase family protein [Acidobacteriaceae bacterium]
MMLWTMTVPAEAPGRHVDLYCHRTANEDVPENTLESLDQAALLGCDVVEVDVRRTLDGELVLNHDGFLERLTDGAGEVETSFYGELALLDAGAWMGERFAGMRMARFEDALRLARGRGVRLILDLKTKGMGPDVIAMLKREGMLERVQFNGEWSDVKELLPGANTEHVRWLQPGVTAEQVAQAHAAGMAVVANFSANGHAMDLEAMRAAVRAGVDGINVDYPRLGAEAAGRPVELRLRALREQADGRAEEAGSEAGNGRRTAAILELARYRGFPKLRAELERWLLDADPAISRAAALALVTSRPRTPVAEFAAAVRSERAPVRANAAWALGMLRAPTREVAGLLEDEDAGVRQAALGAVARMRGRVGERVLRRLLQDGSPGVRGAAALALARHAPTIAAKEVPARLRLEVAQGRVAYEDYVRRKRPQLTAAEIARITDGYRCQMKMVQAIAQVSGLEATRALEEQAF